jgi:hypothetical protein
VFTREKGHPKGSLLGRLRLYFDFDSFQPLQIVTSTEHVHRSLQGMIFRSRGRFKKGGLLMIRGGGEKVAQGSAPQPVVVAGDYKTMPRSPR